jgi:hypothetical protein
VLGRLKAGRCSVGDSEPSRRLLPSRTMLSAFSYRLLREMHKMEVYVSILFTAVGNESSVYKFRKGEYRRILLQLLLSGRAAYLLLV